MSATSFQVKNSLVVNGAITVNSSILQLNTASLSIGGSLGTNGQVVTSINSGLAWRNPLLTAPPGLDTQISYNNSGSFAASGGLTFNYINNNLTISNTITVGNTSIHAQINSTSFSVPVIVAYGVSGHIVIPSNTTRAWVRMIAGGFASGGSYYTGGYLEKFLSSLTPGLFMNSVVGAGGSTAGATTLTSGTQVITSLICPASGGYPTGGDFLTPGFPSTAAVSSPLGVFGASGLPGAIVIMWFP